MPSATLSASRDILHITMRATCAQTPDVRASTLKAVAEEIPSKDLFKMAQQICPQELKKVLWDLVIPKLEAEVKSGVDEANARLEKSANEKNWNESRGGAASESASSTTTKPKSLFEQISKKNWGDSSDEDDSSGYEDFPAKAPARAKTGASGPWANAASDPFPTLQSSVNHRMPPGRAPRRQPPARAGPGQQRPATTNYNATRVGTKTSELDWGGVYTPEEREKGRDSAGDWFFWGTDKGDDPVGWRKTNGWFTSRPNALFRHKRSNSGNTWIRQTKDPVLGWVTKEQEIYVQMMRASANHLD
jgi:hypothetical protein